MNVSELSNNLYRQAGVDAARLKQLQSARRSDRPESLGEEHGGPKFSAVLAELAEKHAPAVSASAASGETSASEKSSALSENQLRDILKKELSSSTISSDLVKALTDEDGNVSESLLDLILNDEEDEEVMDTLISTDPDAALNRMLTDRDVAQEYLSSSSGRNLMAAMAQRSLSGLVS
ncbi:MAG: hypothetical protein K5852_05185 [Eubacterium sp.]|nr:hypothetical protein [Eubacterium sp.]